jgi:carboxymethylenebutenolidase
MGNVFPLSIFDFRVRRYHWNYFQSSKIIEDIQLEMRRVMRFEAGQKTSDGYLAVPSSGTGPGVLVLHAWWGLNDFMISLCNRLADSGFVVVAPDLYFGAIANTVSEAERLRDIHSANEESAGKTASDALTFLKEHPATQSDTVGVLGFSLGAWWSLQLAERHPDIVSAVVLFYGLGESYFVATKAAYQGHFAENDPFEPLEFVPLMESQIKSAGKEAEFFVYPNVGHWFFESDRPDAYNAEAAQLAYDRTLNFLTHKILP